MELNAWNIHWTENSVLELSLVGCWCTVGVGSIFYPGKYLLQKQLKSGQFMLHIVCSVLASLQRPYLLLLLLPSNRVFAIMYLKQTMVLGYNIAAVLSLQYLTHVILFPVIHILYFYIRTLWSMCAVSSMAVFCNPLMLCFANMLFRYCLNDSEVVRVGPIITGVSFIFTFHIHCVYIVRYLYFKIFFASFLLTFLSPEIARSTNDAFLFQIIFKWHIPIVQISLYIYGICHHPTTLSIIYNGYCFGLLFSPTSDCSKLCMFRWWPE
jgi:hypothetical protein